MTKFFTDRRRFMAGAAATALASPVYLRSSMAQSSKVVNIWTYDGFLPEAFVEKFENDTGIEVRVRLVDDQGKQFNLLVAEQPNPSVDILTVAGHRYVQFIDSELIAPFDSDRMASWKNLNPVYSEAEWSTINGEKWGVPLLAGIEAMAYNTDYVDEADRHSWDSIFSEKYANQTAYILDGMFGIVLIMMGYDPNLVAYLDDHEKAQAVVNEGRDFLLKNKHLVRKYYDSGAEIQQMLVNQDVVLCHSWNGAIAKLIMDGMPFGMTIPKEGTLGFVYSMNIANNARNVDNAYTFLNAMLEEPSIGAEMTRSSGFISTYADASSHLTEIERSAASFSNEELERLQFYRQEGNQLAASLMEPAIEEIKAS